MMEGQSRVRTTLLVAPVGVLTLLPTGVAASALAASDAVGLVDPDTGIWSLSDGAGIRAGFPFSGDLDCNGIDAPGLCRQSDGYDVASIGEWSSTGEPADLVFAVATRQLLRSPY